MINLFIVKEEGQKAIFLSLQHLKLFQISESLMLIKLMITKRSHTSKSICIFRKKYKRNNHPQNKRIALKIYSISISVLLFTLLKIKILNDNNLNNKISRISIIRKETGKTSKRIKKNFTQSISTKLIQANLKMYLQPLKIVTIF